MNIPRLYSATLCCAIFLRSSPVEQIKSGLDMQHARVRLKKILETRQKQITLVLMVYNTMPTVPAFRWILLPPSSWYKQSKKRRH